MSLKKIAVLSCLWATSTIYASDPRDIASDKKTTLLSTSYNDTRSSLGSSPEEDSVLSISPSTNSSPNSSDSEEEAGREIAKKLKLNAKKILPLNLDQSTQWVKDSKTFLKIMKFFDQNITGDDLQKRIPSKSQATLHGYFILCLTDSTITTINTPMGAYDVKSIMPKNLKVTFNNLNSSVLLSRELLINVETGEIGVSALEGTVIRQTVAYRTGSTIRNVLVKTLGSPKTLDEYDDYFTPYGGDLTPTSNQELWNAINF
jgi:hypothetical protein